MVLATINENNPRSRFVLFKNIVNDNLIFHTHYESPKAMEIFANPSVSGIFYWAEIHRQVRFQGKAKKAEAKKKGSGQNTPRGITRRGHSIRGGPFRTNRMAVETMGP